MLFKGQLFGTTLATPKHYLRITCSTIKCLQDIDDESISNRYNILYKRKHFNKRNHWRPKYHLFNNWVSFPHGVFRIRQRWNLGRLAVCVPKHNVIKYVFAKQKRRHCFYNTGISSNPFRKSSCRSRRHFPILYSCHVWNLNITRNHCLQQSEGDM